MINVDSIANENNKEHNEKWPDHPYRILIIGGSESGKTNALLKEQWRNKMIYLFVCKRFTWTQVWPKKWGNVGTDHFNDPNAFIECSKRIDDVYQNFDDYNPSRQRKILIVFHDMITDVMSKKNFKP